MPSYSSHITATDALFVGLAAGLFPGGVKPQGLFFDEAPTMAGSATRISPPYVLLFDDGVEPRWTFKGEDAESKGQNALVEGSFRLEAYDYKLGDTDRVIAAILWGGEVPNKRAGLAFASFSLLAPQKGMAGSVIPGRARRRYAGFQYNNKRVHCTDQSFRVKYTISGDGL